MAYTPINWAAGDTITAEKLNRCDNGWGYESTQLFSETVTTETSEYGSEGTLAYLGNVSPAELTVVFDNIEYTCPFVAMENNNHGYGGVTSNWTYDFSTYPFAIIFTGYDNVLATKTAGTHSVAASFAAMDVSANFATAVEIAGMGLFASSLQVVEGTTTWQDAHDALAAGKYVYIVSNESAVSICHVFRADTSPDYNISFLFIGGSTSSGVTISHLSADSADGVLGA